MKKNLSVLLVILSIAFSSCKTEKKDASLAIPFEKYTLENGLTVILNEDKSDPIAAVAILYHVGSSRESEGKTGFAHLFEHMMFQKSENVGEDQLFKLIQGAGGELNGGTSQDNTVYYEVVPKNSLEMTLWLESDRMGYLENTVTKAAFVNQQNVVQNEKRESVDNSPYGFNEYLILKNLYPKGHPYSWDVIGEMADLTNATVDDVKAFHKKFYSPNNATLVISGDISKEEVKLLVEKYFGEIPKGEPIETRTTMPAPLASTVKIYHEDSFAKAPLLTMVYPGAAQFTKDAYALDYLASLLSDGKKTPLYKVLIKDKKLTSEAYAWSGAQELTGAFRISVTANPGGNLNDVEKAVFEAFDMFEKEGFSEEDLTRIKAKNETNFYNSFSSILSKAFTLGAYQMFKNDPQYYSEDFATAQSVTMADVKAAYEKYIKGKNYVETSFVPKGETTLIVENSVKSDIVEEDVTKAAEVKAEPVAEEPIVKTPTKFDRSVQPVAGPDPEVTIPPVWKSSISNGMKIWGIAQNELPLVQYSIVISGGHLLDTQGKEGLANLTASSLNDGTKNKTPEQLEDAIKLLGAYINVYAETEKITISVNTLARNFEKTLTLVEEMLLEPRWDEEQFNLARTREINNIKNNQADPNYLGSSNLNKLIFGEGNILATDLNGTEESVNSITIDDLKGFWEQYFSPSVAQFMIVGSIDQPRVEKALASLNEKWKAKEVTLPQVITPEGPEKSQVYFIDVPGAKQSVIYIGSPSISRTNPDYYPAYVTNYKLGGSFNGIFNLILREEKGFTYGARSGFSNSTNYGKYSASSMVRTNSTLESVTIFKTEMEKYRKEVPQEYVDFTKSALLKSNARNFETTGSLLSMLNTMVMNGLPADYIKQQEAFVRGLTSEKVLELANKYIDPARMYYVVVGDAKTQLNDLEKVGFGKPVLVK